MKVTKAQAQANRARVVETASQLFRERGYDGVGVADLMAAAGFTHGGFYKQFGSKTDLIAESTACGIAQTVAMTEGGLDAASFVAQYLSREHRDGRATGCTMAALAGDAARQPDTVKAAFAAGIESLIAAFSANRESALRAEGSEGSAGSDGRDQPDADETRNKILNTLSQAVGALVLSRACPDDSPLADEFLNAGRAALFQSLGTDASRGRPHLPAEPGSVAPTPGKAP